jgi:hypothetical protein
MLANKRLSLLDNKTKNAAKQFQKYNKITLDIESPKVIVDEYLLAEKVLNRNRPMFFLFDMGSWKASNSTVKQRADALDKMK